MAGKTLRRVVTFVDTSDADNLAKVKAGDPSAHPLEQVTLYPGDEVPSWVDEDDLDESWFEDPMTSAGSNLFDDNVYQVVKGAADDAGVEYGDDWSAEQIAAAVRHHQQGVDAVAEHGETSVDPMSGDEVDVAGAYSDSAAAMSSLFGDSNAAGNVNGPDQAEKKPSRSKASTSGAQSSAT